MAQDSFRVHLASLARVSRDVRSAVNVSYYVEDYVLHEIRLGLLVQSLLEDSQQRLHKILVCTYRAGLDLVEVP